MNKRIKIALFAILFATTACKAQSVTFCYNGAWGAWSESFSRWDGLNFAWSNTISYYVDGSGFVYKDKTTQLTFFEFQISRYYPPTKQEIKQHLKNNQWYEYSGTVSYYVTDEFPTAKDIAKEGYFIKPNPRTDKTPCVKRTALATIKIAPYKKQPECYNLWFDGIGIGLDVRGLRFK